jgi:pectate lyase
MRRTIASVAAAGMLVAGAVTVALTGGTAGAEVRAYAAATGFGAGTTGGAGGATVTVSSTSAFLSAVQSSSPTVVQVSGTISLSGMNKVASNKTIVGLGTGARLTGGGLNISRVSNVIVQNLTITGSSDDNINVEYSTRVFIDHNNLSNAYDGNLDIKRASDRITVSWNRFSNQDKNALLGHSDSNASEDTGKLHVTYHHNWFDGVNQRNPRVRFGNPVHVYNNYYSNIGSYGVASTENAGVLVEKNYFENVEDPYHLGEGDSGPGALVARDNYKVNSGAGQTGGSVASIPYSYTADTASSVKSIVTSGAGVH